jgi:hypothetical protein
MIIKIIKIESKENPKIKARTAKPRTSAEEEKKEKL